MAKQEREAGSRCGRRYLPSAKVFEEELNMQAWLVEIRLKDWEPSLRGGSRVVAYEEVVAFNQIAARHAGYDQFAARCGSDPVMRRHMSSLGLTQHNCCAPDAVELDD